MPDTLHARARRPRSGIAPIAILVAVSASGAGCWNHIEDHCVSRTVIDHRRPEVAPIRDGARVLVALVPGAFGFGAEWDPVIPALRAAPDLDFFVYRWPGPWVNPPRSAAHLADALQSVVDVAPSSVTEVLVLAHSAGGLITNYAARKLRVPPGRHVTIALLDSPFDRNVSPQRFETEVNTPLGLAVGSTQAPYPPIPVGVTMTDYAAKAPRPDAQTREIHRVYVGAVGHNPMVALVSLPLIAELLARAR